MKSKIKLTTIETLGKVSRKIELDIKEKEMTESLLYSMAVCAKGVESKNL